MDSCDQRYREVCRLLGQGEKQAGIATLEELVECCHIQSIIHLADLYAKGNFVETNLDIAIGLYELATSLGSEEAEKLAAAGLEG